MAEASSAMQEIRLPQGTVRYRDTGAGEPIVFVHGSFGWGEETFLEQRALADGYRVLLVDRRGFGESPPAGNLGFEAQAGDVAAVLADAAHLVGSSYGGLLCLLAAARRPAAVRSLTVIEPPAFSVARGDPAVERFVDCLAPWYAHARETPPDRLYASFVAAFGFNSAEEKPSHKDLAAAITSGREPPPWEAEVPLDLLAGALFPKLVVSGGWDLAPARAREIAGRAFAVVCDVLEERLGAERAVFPGAAHNPQLLGRPFNERLRAFLARADQRLG
jgi:pimeloyl-ACP methyl ester carboxylesterase